MRQLAHRFILLFLTTCWTFSVSAEEDRPEVSAFGNNAVINCTSTPIAIGIIITDDFHPGMAYTWSNGATDSVIYVKPLTTQTFTLEVENEDLDFHRSFSFVVNVENAPITLRAEDVVLQNPICDAEVISLSAEVSGGHGPFSYAWSNGGTSATIEATIGASQQLSVEVTDACGSMDETTLNVLVPEATPLSISNIEPKAFTCDEIAVSVDFDLSQVSGGVGYGYQYSFDNWASVNAPIELIPNETQEIEVQVTDLCHRDVLTRKVKLERVPVEVPAAESLIACVNDDVNLLEGLSSRFVYRDVSTVYQQSFDISTQSDTSFELIYIDECSNPHMVTRNVLVSQPEANFELYTEATSGVVEVTDLSKGAIVSSAWYVNGEPTSIDGIEAKMNTGQENSITLVTTDNVGCKSQKTRHVSMAPAWDIPTAFSPNGDGVNDAFYIAFGDELESFQIKIFDRWGQLVYTSSDQYFAWSGPEGRHQNLLNTYVYKITARTKGGDNLEKHGTISTVNYDN